MNTVFSELSNKWEITFQAIVSFLFLRKAVWAMPFSPEVRRWIRCGIVWLIWLKPRGEMRWTSSTATQFSSCFLRKQFKRQRLSCSAGSMLLISFNFLLFLRLSYQTHHGYANNTFSYKIGFQVFSQCKTPWLPNWLLQNPFRMYFFLRVCVWTGEVWTTHSQLLLTFSFLVFGIRCSSRGL